MPEIGWIKLHRKIRENPFWDDKPFDKARAWIDLILSANHDSNKFLLGNEMVSVDRGSFITSEKKLMEKWGWSKSKVRAFLSLLENQSMIVKKTDSKKTTLEVLNYCIYQDFETTKEPQKDRKKTAKELQKDTNNNDKNVKNDKKDTSSRTNKFADDSIELSLASELFNLVLGNNQNAKQPNLQTWAKDFDLIIRVDKQSAEDVRKVMKWSQKDSFWQGNILSPGALRKQFGKLVVQMKTRGDKVAKGPSTNLPKTPKDKYDNFYL